MLSLSSIGKNRFGRITFAGLLHHIVMHTSEALPLLKLAHKTQGLPSCRGFWIYKARDGSGTCDCWFDLEYFDFVEEKHVNADLLGVVCKNLERGKCQHVVETEGNGEEVSMCQFTCGVTLLHAAAASGNKPVVKHLVEVDTSSVYTASSTGVKPFHIAIIKSQRHVLKHLYLRKARDWLKTYREFFSNVMKLVFRDKITGKLSDVYSARWQIDKRNDFEYNTGCLLWMYDIKDKKMVAKLFNILDRINLPTVMLQTLVYLVQKNAKALARMVLSLKQFNRTSSFDDPGRCQELVIACVLSDADDILQLLSDRHVYCEFHVQGYNMLDFAKAIGSQKCVSMLKTFLPETPNVYQMVSPHMLLFVSNQYFPHMDYRSVFQRCAEQGFDVNESGKQFSTSPIHVAIVLHMTEFVTILLDLGANVDSKCHGDTPVLISVLNHDIHLLKELLLYNPSPDASKDILYKAVECDVESSKLQFVHSDKIITFRNKLSTTEAVVVAETIEDRYVAISFFALLYEFGFAWKRSYKDYLQRNIERYERMNLRQRDQRNEDSLLILKEFHNYISNVTSRPRSLQSYCRIVVRKAFPGHRLHKYLSSTAVPQTLVSYIVSPYILRQVVIESRDDPCLGDTSTR